MDITIIEEAIDALENEDTTLNNIEELASLYIVRNNYSTALKRQITATQAELNDLFPYYTQYVEIKKDYFNKKVSEGAVIQSIKSLCKELKQFIETLYNSTDMPRERKEILKTMEGLIDIFKK